jgi:AraC-like DNA-binding protein
MNADQLRLSEAVLTRLRGVGADTAHAEKAARLAAEQTVSTETFFAFWEALGAASPAEVGLRLAEATRTQDYDLASLAALSSPDVRTALEKLARYKRLCGPKDLFVDERGADVSVHTVWQHAPGPAPARLVDASLASLVVLLQRGTGLPLAPKRVELSRARGEEPMLLRFFGCPLRFRATHDALVPDAETLSLPFVTHNDGLLQALLPSLDARLAPLREPPLLAQIRAAIARRMSGERPSIEKVARELAMSPRTLQRRLGELDRSYQTVLDEVREDTARRLLRAGELSVGEIAFLLGFEELNSFTRAFRGWVGQTPLAFRAAAPARRARSATLRAGAIG